MWCAVSPVEPVRLPPVREEPAVHDEPPPRTLVRGTAPSTVPIAVEFRSGAPQRVTGEAVDAVIPSLVTTSRDAGAGMPPGVRQQPGPGPARALGRGAGERRSAEGDPGRSGG